MDKDNSNFFLAWMTPLVVMILLSQSTHANGFFPNPCPSDVEAYPFGPKEISEKCKYYALGELSKDRDANDMICSALFESRMKRLEIMQKSLQGHIGKAENAMEERILEYTLSKVHEVSQSINQICAWMQK